MGKGRNVHRMSAHTSIKRFPSHHSLSPFLAFDRGEKESILLDVAAGLKSSSELTQFTTVHFSAEPCSKSVLYRQLLFYKLHINTLKILDFGRLRVYPYDCR